MKRIEAVIAPWTLDKFKEAAAELGIAEFDLVQVYRSGSTTAAGRQRLCRGREFAADLLPRLKLEFVLFDDDVQTTLHQLLEFVSPESIAIFKVDQTIRPAKGHFTDLPPLRHAMNHPAEAAVSESSDLFHQRATKTPTTVRTLRSGTLAMVAPVKTGRLNRALRLIQRCWLRLVERARHRDVDQLPVCESEGSYTRAAKVRSVAH